MIRSMTGYGDAELDTRVGRLRAEIRTVNHRYFSANLRLARALEHFEPLVRESLRGQLPRGHVNFALRLETAASADGAAAALRVDDERAQAYVQVLRGLKDRLGLPGEVDLALLTRFSDLIVPAEEAETDRVDAEHVQQVTIAAAAAAVRMREQEGLRLAQDLEERLVAVESALGRIGARAPERLVNERERMRRVLAELLEGAPIDEERIVREAAYMAERWDVSEELVRMRSHLELFRATMAAASEEPVGKRLGFLTQEMNRETNTIGSKANDAGIEHDVIAIKDEIERLREQIENVE
jgi:uncharacterized protein (TIGR00255 family)